MLGQITCKQHSGLYALLLHVLNYCVAVHTFPAGDKETKPARSGVLGRNREDQAVFRLRKSGSQTVKVVSSALHEGREFLDLRAADRCLKVCRFQVIAEMGVYIFVVIAQWKFSVLSVETMSAHIVMSGRADAVAAPVGLSV